MRTTVEQVTLGSHDLCPACGHANSKQDDNGLFRIDCANCGESILTFGKVEQVEVDISTTINPDGSATVSMKDVES